MSHRPTAEAAVRLLPERAVPSLEDYVAAGGGAGLRRALEMDPAEVREQVRRSGLRGRGGAGFPTGVKWASVVEAADAGGTVYLVCNAAEGEPGTYKDRVLMRRNPYQMLEGVLIAMHATGAAQAYIPTKERFVEVRERLAEALQAMRATRWEGADRVQLVAGPDAYLFGEESAMLEVIEGRLPMPRILPPYQQGLFADISHANPTVVNNVETLSHVSHILARGDDWFREVGTVETPGTMVFSVLGDVDSPGVYELPMGTPMRTLIVDIAGARDVKAIYSGVSNTVITPDLLDLPMDFDSFREAGSGLGSGGFVVYDSSRDIVQVLAQLQRFLGIESCGQCNACKLGNMDMAERLDKFVRGEGTSGDIEQLRKRLATVTDQNRCYLPVGAQLTVGSTLEAFAEEFHAHVGKPADPAVAVMVPKVIRLHPDTGDVTLDDDYWRKRPDWSSVTERPADAWPGRGAVAAQPELAGD
ncbi:MAG TPA: NADH-ubiquinone oxidoreductase-F iron-sulfur binding region domain-containing protein [Egibacteraceae bacterium]|nr:NADH-ubiquinone oxidoreductase-F iron-sulfur binding region domain-containing protein [Egibacteraceae bacterium]